MILGHNYKLFIVRLLKRRLQVHPLVKRGCAKKMPLSTS